MPPAFSVARCKLEHELPSWPWDKPGHDELAMRVSPAVHAAARPAHGRRPFWILKTRKKDVRGDDFSSASDGRIRWPGGWHQPALKSMKKRREKPLALTV
jgi:hypothetical protein